jgi:hypothetical protein
MPELGILSGTEQHAVLLRLNHCVNRKEPLIRFELSGAWAAARPA